MTATNDPYIATRLAIAEKSGQLLETLNRTDSNGVVHPPGKDTRSMDVAFAAVHELRAPAAERP